MTDRLSRLTPGDIITIDNCDASQGMRGPWRVGETLSDGRVRLHPAHGMPADAFNDAVGEFFLEPASRWREAQQVQS